MSLSTALRWALFILHSIRFNINTTAMIHYWPSDIFLAIRFVLRIKRPFILIEYGEALSILDVHFRRDRELWKGGGGCGREIHHIFHWRVNTNWGACSTMLTVPEHLYDNNNNNSSNFLKRTQYVSMTFRLGPWEYDEMSIFCHNLSWNGELIE